MKVLMQQSENSKPCPEFKEIMDSLEQQEFVDDYQKILSVVLSQIL